VGNIAVKEIDNEKEKKSKHIVKLELSKTKTQKEMFRKHSVELKKRLMKS
jgi:hypothetical protein